MGKRVLILGGAGMLGHKAWQVFRSNCDAYVTVRKDFSFYQHYDLFDKERTLYNVDVSRQDVLESVIEKVKPDVVVNCVGIIKQSSAVNDPIISIEINALFPHRLALVCNKLGIRLIHISSDCVFSGKKGNYIEDDCSDAQDFYGRTKFLGEVSYGDALTLRTSIIGRELNSRYGLIEWFLSQTGSKVRGYTKAVFSGFTTRVLCDIILNIINQHRELRGLYNLSSEPVTKFDLLSLVKEIFKLNIEIEPEDNFVCDRSLDSNRFRGAVNFKPPSWRDMIVDMRQDWAYYDRLRNCVGRG